METYRSATRAAIERFLEHRLTFEQCQAALNAALADLTFRLTSEQIAPLRELISENNEIVLKEMERRGRLPRDLKILSALGDATTVSTYHPNQMIYAQGDSGEAVFYIQKGRVKLTVLSKLGKQAVLGILGARSFFGEACLMGQQHAATATTLSKSSIVRLDKSSVIRLLGENVAFSEMFLAHLLSRSLRMEEEMAYQILNSYEKRLARVLLTLADFGKRSKPKEVIPKISFGALAQMVGTTISRISFFMKKFRKLGFIDYNGELKINSSLLTVVLHDQVVHMPTDRHPETPSPHPAPGR